MKDILAWELKRRRSAILWWTIGSIILTFVILALYPSIRDKAHQLNQVIDQMPSSLRGLKTGGARAIDVGDPAQFLNSQLFYITLPMIWIILAITRGAAILGKEERDHTLELLLARPLSRVRLLIGKALALGTEYGIVTAVTLVFILLVSPLYDLHIGSKELAFTTLYTALFSLSFGYLAFCLQAANALTKRAATAFAVALSFGGYIIASLSSLTDWLSTPSKFVPYHYFNPLDMLEGHTTHGLLVYLVGVFVLGSLVAYLGFRHRDIE